MTFKILNNLIKKHSVPDDVVLKTDSGWECCETEMDGVYYSEELNEIVFTQNFGKDSGYENSNWKELK